MKKRALMIFLCVNLVFLSALAATAGQTGVWKPHDGGVSFYVQACSDGSALVVTTPDGENYYVFVDGNMADGISASEYYGRAAALSMSFDPDGTALAVLTLGNSTQQYALSKVLTATDPISGIWKPSDLSNNFFVQTYSDGSALVIVSPDGNTFYVFVDSSASEEFSADELFGKQISLSITFDEDGGSADAILTGTQGIDTYALTNQTPVYHTDAFGIRFVYIPEGTFDMGSPAELPDFPYGEPGRDDGEIQHEVTISKGFFMQITEVTQGLWKQVMGTNPSAFNTCGDNCPVEQVDFFDVLKFIEKLNASGQGFYRLPTEAEWEYAARAGSVGQLGVGFYPIHDHGTSFIVDPYSCGYDPFIDPRGWYCANSASATHPVATKAANDFRLHDMHGNVAEWCEDWYGDYTAASVTDPTGPSTGLSKVVRGGSWADGPKSIRCANRDKSALPYKSDQIGFRLVFER